VGGFSTSPLVMTDVAEAPGHLARRSPGDELFALITPSAGIAGQREVLVPEGRSALMGFWGAALY
jgi:hypothetical protein